MLKAECMWRRKGKDPWLWYEWEGIQKERNLLRRRRLDLTLGYRVWNQSHSLKRERSITGIIPFYSLYEASIFTAPIRTVSVSTNNHKGQALWDYIYQKADGPGIQFRRSYSRSERGSGSAFLDFFAFPIFVRYIITHGIVVYNSYRWNRIRYCASRCLSFKIRIVSAVFWSPWASHRRYTKSRCVRSSEYFYYFIFESQVSSWTWYRSGGSSSPYKELARSYVACRQTAGGSWPSSRSLRLCSLFVFMPVTINFAMASIIINASSEIPGHDFPLFGISWHENEMRSEWVDSLSGRHGRNWNFYSLCFKWQTRSTRNRLIYRWHGSDRLHRDWLSWSFDWVGTTIHTASV